MEVIGRRTDLVEMLHNYVLLEACQECSTGYTVDANPWCVEIRLRQPYSATRSTESCRRWPPPEMHFRRGFHERDSRWAERAHILLSLLLFTVRISHMPHML